MISTTTTPRSFCRLDKTASGAASDNSAVYNVNSSSAVITNLRADASGGASNYGVFTSNYGAFTGGTIRIDHSVINGTTGSIFTDTTYTALIANTRISGTVTNNGTTTCAGVYNNNYTFYANTCP